jgi:hypothetical protein
MQKSTLNGLHTAGVLVMVDKRRTGIGVEVDAGIGLNTVDVAFGRLWGV